MFDFGIVLSIEHTSTLHQHLDCLAVAVLAAKDPSGSSCSHARTGYRCGPGAEGVRVSAVVSTAVKAVFCRQSDGGVLNF